jgi:hypothetical protein
VKSSSYLAALAESGCVPPPCWDQSRLPVTIGFSVLAFISIITLAAGLFVYFITAGGIELLKKK